MYNKILILLICISLVLLINYYSIFLQETQKIKGSIENLPNKKKDKKKDTKKVTKKVKFKLNGIDNIDTFINKKQVEPYSMRPQNSNDYIKQKTLVENSNEDNMSSYYKLTTPEFLEMEGENINTASGTPYNVFKTVSIPSQIVYSNEDKDLITYVNLNSDNDIKSYSNIGSRSLFK